MRALYTAATGMMAQEMNVQVISNNIANMRTTGYKRQRANFEDLLYQNFRQVGTATSDAGNILPAGFEIGSGVKVAATPRVMSQGNVTPTEKELDVAIRGEGLLPVRMPDGRTGYTRSGALELDNTGQLVTAEGYLIEPGITIPPNSSGLTITAQGQVQVTPAGNAAPVTLGQIQLATFINKSGLLSIGDNLFVETGASGPPQLENPGTEGTGTLLQRSLEEANVNAVTEISDLIAAQRAYEMNAKVVSAAGSMLEATANLR